MKTLLKLSAAGLLTAFCSFVNTEEKALYPGEKPPGFAFSGAWQPSRVSGPDGVTDLDVKIGRFVNLPPDELSRVIFNVNGKFPGSKAIAFWAVGDMTGLIPAHEGLSEAQHENYLRLMDSLGVAVFPEIFPSKEKGTDIIREIDYWLGRFGHHPSVAGFGIDLEYFEKATDERAKAWDQHIKKYNSRYRLFLRHYSPDYMPPTYRGKGDIIFVDSASEAELEVLNDVFKSWADRFAPATCIFQIGYPADEDNMAGSNAGGWWKLQDPIKDWGNMILATVYHPGQELGLVWVTARSGKSYHQSWDLTR